MVEAREIPWRGSPEGVWCIVGNEKQEGACRLPWVRATVNELYCLVSELIRDPLATVGGNDGLIAAEPGVGCITK